MKLFGIFDLFCALILFIVGTGADLPMGLVLFCSAILIIKAFMGFGFGGFIDIISASFLFLGIFTNPPFLIYLLLMILLGQKGLISIFIV